MWCYLVWVIWDEYTLFVMSDVIRDSVRSERCDKKCDLLNYIGCDIKLELNKYMFDRVGDGRYDMSDGIGVI